MSSLMELLLSQPSLAQQVLPMVAKTQQYQPSGMGEGRLNPSFQKYQPPTQPQTPSMPQVGANVNDWEARAQKMAYNRYNYTPQDWAELQYIIGHESSWDPNAVNPTSGAYGIPQILPAAHPDANLQNDPMGQLHWLFSYLQDRYGGVDAAYQHKLSTGWY